MYPLRLAESIVAKVQSSLVVDTELGPLMILITDGKAAFILLVKSLKVVPRPFVLDRDVENSTLLAVEHYLFPLLQRQSYSKKG